MFGLGGGKDALVIESFVEGYVFDMGDVSRDALELSSLPQAIADQFPINH